MSKVKSVTTNYESEKKQNENFISIKKNLYIKKEISNFKKACLSNATHEDSKYYIKYKLGELSTSIGLSEDEPGYQIKPALQEMIAKKVKKDSIIDLVRVVQADILDSTFTEIDGHFNKQCNWGLFILNRKGNPIYKVNIDDLLIFDGKEFLPREVKKKLKVKKSKYDLCY